MIVMDIKADNFFAFTNFHMNMSYPKKIVDSYIENEYLKERTNFRYKKVNVLMGGNASGKTSVGQMIMAIFNFIMKKNLDIITRYICDNNKPASFSMDFIIREYKLYRIEALIQPKKDKEYTSYDADITVKVVNINKSDNYESCARRLDQAQAHPEEDYVKELEKAGKLTWIFQYPSTNEQLNDFEDDFEKILNNTLCALDPAIIKVEKIGNVENSYVIRMKHHDIIIQEGKIVKENLLSSGTEAGIDIANMIAAIKSGRYGFHYCDEKFSFIHSDMEKAFLSVMISSLGENDQLFFTTHNMDILDMQLPMHSFSFLKKDIYNDKNSISCISAAEYLKRNTDSLRRAVENDLFSVAPDVGLVYDILEM